MLDNVTINQLRAFVAVCDQGSFSGAARELKRAQSAIAEAGVPQVSIAVDTYFPRAHLIECLRSLQADFPTVAIDLHITTMQGGERLVLKGTCA
jgi:DNA-binding transcriptional LysR family regulator